jgi:hypothetical protein
MIRSIYKIIVINILKKKTFRCSESSNEIQLGKWCWHFSKTMPCRLQCNRTASSCLDPDRAPAFFPVVSRLSSLSFSRATNIISLAMAICKNKNLKHRGALVSLAYQFLLILNGSDTDSQQRIEIYATHTVFLYIYRFINGLVVLYMLGDIAAQILQDY